MTSPKCDIMLSYQWASQSLVEKVFNTLTTLGFSVWMDSKNGSIRHNNIYDAMAEGVSNASVVLVFMTQAYEASENCKNELSLCGDRKIARIPILVQKDWKPNPSKWLGFLTAGKLWIEMNETNYLSKMDELTQHIFHVVPQMVPQVVAQSSPSVQESLCPPPTTVTPVSTRMQPPLIPRRLLGQVACPVARTPGGLLGARVAVRRS
jgi:hypothetical protein